MTDPTMFAPARLDPRVARSRRHVLDTTKKLVADDGIAVTLESIVGASGVAKTTIYRIWDSKSDLIAEVVDELIDNEGPPLVDDERNDNTSRVLEHIARLAADPLWGRVLVDLAVEAQRGSSLRPVHLDLIQRWQCLLTRATDADDHPASSADVDLVVGAALQHGLRDGFDPTVVMRLGSWLGGSADR